MIDSKLVEKVNIHELVKALRERAQREEEWYEHGGDLISNASAAIEELQEELGLMKIAADGNGEMVKWLQAEVKRLEPKRGDWIDDGTEYGIHWFKCSVCGESQDIPTVMLKPYYKYCPVCGAKMEVQE